MTVKELIDGIKRLRKDGYSFDQIKDSFERMYINKKVNFKELNALCKVLDYYQKKEQEKIKEKIKMNKKYAIIIEEQKNQRVNQSVEEVKTINDVLDTLLFNTDFFTPTEDGVTEELIERRDYLELAKEIAYCSCNQEPQTTRGKRYCDILNDIKTSDSIESCYNILNELNKLLEESNHQIKVFLNEREDDGCGWNGLEE